jgi:hypothetical protein
VVLLSRWGLETTRARFGASEPALSEAKGALRVSVVNWYYTPASILAKVVNTKA